MPLLMILRDKAMRDKRSVMVTVMVVLVMRMMMAVMTLRRVSGGNKKQTKSLETRDPVMTRDSIKGF